LLLGPTKELIPRFEMKSGAAPGGHGQPLAFPGDRVAQMLAHQLRVVQVMVFDQNLITMLDVLGPLQQPDGHPLENSLFVSRWPTKRSFALFHARRLKNFRRDVPQKMLKPLNGNGLTDWKDAPCPARSKTKMLGSGHKNGLTKHKVAIIGQGPGVSEEDRTKLFQPSPNGQTDQRGNINWAGPCDRKAHN
jgi:hypothetical protein